MRTNVYFAYALIWLNDKYYLRRHDKYNNVSNYRVDRILLDIFKSQNFLFGVRVALSIWIRNASAGKDSAAIRVCWNRCWTISADGWNLFAAGKNTFTVLVSVNSSEGLYEWVAQFGPEYWCSARFP